MTWQTLGLIDFVTVVAVIIPVLLYDKLLAEEDKTLITDYIRANPWAAFVVLCLIMQGVMGLAVHFMAPVRIEDAGKW
jgi:hypothetical protein